MAGFGNHGGDDKSGGNNWLDKLGPKKSMKEIAEEARIEREKKAEEKKIEEKREKERENREELLGIKVNKSAFVTGGNAAELAAHMAARLSESDYLDTKA
jgi:hypothetical protein